MKFRSRSTTIVNLGWRAVFARKEDAEKDVSSVVRQYYNNSYTSVVSQFVEEEKMDLDELRALIAEIEKSRK